MNEKKEFNFGGRLRPAQEVQTWGFGQTRFSNERLAFIYQRLSTYEQVRKSIWSIELQNRLADRARADGYPDELIYVEKRDLGLSGTLGREDRPGLACLIQRIEADLVESAYTVEIGRLHRDTTLINALQLGELFKKHGVIIVTSSLPPLDLRNDYDMEIYRMEVQRAARELRMMKARLLEARDAKAEKGLYSGEALPSGLVVDPRERVGGQVNPTFGQFTVYEPHAVVVRLILDKLYTGWSFRKIARWCWEREVVFPFFEPEFDTSINRKVFARTKSTASGWIVTVDRVQSIATNPAYIGTRIWKGRVVCKDAYPSIVDEQKLFAIQERLEDEYRPCPKKDNDPLSLAGLLHYMRNGVLYRMTYSYQRKDVGLYTEQSDNDIGQSRTCFTDYYLDGPVAEVVLDQIALPNVAEDVLTRLTDQYEQAKDQAASYQRQRRRLEKEIENLEANLNQEVLSEETLKRLAKRIAERQARIRELADLESRPIGRLLGYPVPGQADIELVQDFLANLGEGWERRSNQLKNDLLHLLLDKVIIWNDDDDASIIHCQIHWEVGLEQEIVIHRPYASYVYQSRKRWSEEEITVLKGHFATTPKTELLEMLPGRSWDGIVGKTRSLGLSRPAFRHLPKPRVSPFTPEEDELIRKHYAGQVGLSEVLSMGRPMESIWRRAQRLGFKRQRRVFWEWVDKGGIPEAEGSPGPGPHGCHSPAAPPPPGA